MGVTQQALAVDRLFSETGDDGIRRAGGPSGLYEPRSGRTTGPPNWPSPSAIFNTASSGVFLPVYLLTIVPAPWMKRHRDNPQLKAFVQGATPSATGALTGAVVILGQRAIFDVPTGVVALMRLLLLWRFKLPEPLIVLLSGMIGLSIWMLK